METCIDIEGAAGARGSMFLHAVCFVITWRMFLSSAVAPNIQLFAILIICYLLSSGNTKRLLEVLEVITTQMETAGCLENTIELNRKADTWWPSPPYMIKLVVLYPKDLGVVHCQAKGHPSTHFKNGKIKASKSKMGCPKVTHYGRSHIHKKWDSQH